MKRGLLFRLISLVLFGLLCSPVLWSQSRPKYYDQWCFGENNGLDFRDVPVKRFSVPLYSGEGSASICDPESGALLFYTDGVAVWNRFHEVMPNGDGLYGDISSTQTGVIIPLPGQPNLFYLFTADAGLYQHRQAGINYSIVNMAMDEGKGDVVQKNLPLLPSASEKLVGIRHCNGRDFWVVAHELFSNRFVAWLVTRHGIVDTVYTDIGVVHDRSISRAPSIGYLKASPNGKYLFSVMNTANFGELFGFDNASGVVHSRIAELPADYGASFSPNNTYLYTTDPTRGNEVIRYLLDPPLNASVESTRESIGFFGEVKAMQIAPDSSIYVLIAPSIARIENPDDANPRFRHLGPLLRNITFGLPNCIDGFLGDAESQTVPLIDIARVVGDTVMCFGKSLQLTVEGGNDHRWTPAFGLSCTYCQSPVASPGTTTTYTLRYGYTDCAGYQIDSLQVTVVVQRPPDVDAGKDTTLCPGGTARLDGTSTRMVSYQWEPDPSLSCVDCPDPVASPLETTLYYLTVKDSLGCIARDSVLVQVMDDGLTVPADTAICLGKAVRLPVKGRTNYRWSPSDGLSCDDCADPVATPSKTTTYVVEGTVNGDCRLVDSVTVTVHELPDPVISEDVLLCRGDSTQLHIDGGTEYFWTPAKNLTCLYCPDPVAFPEETTTYYVRVTNASGCVVWDSVQVNVSDEIGLVARGDTSICVGESVRLYAEGAATYQWTGAGDLSCEECPDPSVSPVRTTTYYVTGANAEGRCASTDSVVVRVYEIPVAEAGTGGTVCPGESLQLEAMGGTTYRWDASPELSCLDCPDPVARPGKTATYYVTVWNEGGCSSRDSVQVLVRPILAVDAGEDQVICEGDGTELNVDGGVRWEWSPPDGLSCTDCRNPVATPTETTTYRVRAWNAEGCEGTDEVQVRIREFSRTLRLGIGRDYHGASGEELLIPVEVRSDSAVTDISELWLTLAYDAAVMSLDADSFARLLSGTNLAGWSIDVQEPAAGEVLVHLTAPDGQTLTTGDVLLRFAARLYLSRTRGTELPVTVESNSNCFVIETEAGYAEVDSVCGLDFRLIEVQASRYVAPEAFPNPAHERVRFEFGLGLDGQAVLEVFDAIGNRVGVLVNRHLESGQYSVEWDIRELSSGQYWYRLQSGDWNSTGQLRIEKNE